MKVSRGDVVLVDHPFTDRTGSKVRPTLVVSGSETVHATVSFPDWAAHQLQQKAGMERCIADGNGWY